MEVEKLISMCTHCGFCLETCPTFSVTRNEVHSPRGRIEAIRSKIESYGLQTCMFCRLCETACPAGVKYGQIVLPFRKRNVKQSLFLRSLESPRATYLLLKGSQKISLKEAQRFKEFTKGLKVERQIEGEDDEPEIVLFPGCLEGVLFRETVEKALNFLRKRYKVKIINGCCGLAHFSAGNIEKAKELASRLGTIKKPIVTLQSNCAAHMKEFKELFGLEVEVFDFAEFLIRKGIDLPRKEGKVTIHYPCNAYRKGLTKYVVEVIKKMGINVREMEDPQFECGSGGDYWITHPEMSDKVREIKKTKIEKSGVNTVISTNSVCSLSILRTGFKPLHVADLL
ncbi:(Fe-S)-binding protein [Acidianus sp. RZ1]|uniref:(Fe-S)-binding protein n=1 Tax=Acidianus sp. RZ1 TaxID=1540082 RepID=UPI0020A25B99|nr:(Fe-S)-binding protein [Acidianus sp. RZ1]